MTAEETWAGGRHCARERGAFLCQKNSDEEFYPSEGRTDHPYRIKVWQFGRDVVPLFSMKEIARWKQE